MAAFEPVLSGINDGLKLAIYYRMTVFELMNVLRSIGNYILFIFSFKLYLFSINEQI